MDDGAAELHLAVCRRFGEAVHAANGKWDRRSPCDAWDARGVLEHVIGFHDVLLLRPLGLKPDRPRDDPQLRWELTYQALRRRWNPVGACSNASLTFRSYREPTDAVGCPRDDAEPDPRRVGAYLGPRPRGGRR